MSGLNEERKLLRFLSEKLLSGEISADDYEAIRREGINPLFEAGVTVAEFGDPLPDNEVTNAALRMGFHRMKQKVCALYPHLKTELPESKDSGKER